MIKSSHVWLGTIVFAMTLLSSPVAGAETIPSSIQVPEGNTFLFETLAAGTQNYQCQQAADGSTSWAFKQPKAILIGDAGQEVGIHGRGPFWVAYDGSSVVGSSAVSTPSPDAQENIPWLLLHGTPDGSDGRFAHVSYIQRLDTQGGVAPVGSCEPDQTAAVPYVARYAFYGAD